MGAAALRLPLAALPLTAAAYPLQVPGGPPVQGSHRAAPVGGPYKIKSANRVLPTPHKMQGGGFIRNRPLGIHREVWRFLEKKETKITHMRIPAPYGTHSKKAVLAGALHPLYCPHQ